jgi:hypothetical protein
MKTLLLMIGSMLLFTGCTEHSSADLEAEVASLRSEVSALRDAQGSTPTDVTTVELGQQMLTLQIRHARLWAAGENKNWMLAHFQLAELNEALDGVVELNGDHAALQPDRLADVLPAMMQPAIAKLRAALDAEDKTAFEIAYDGISEACTACHAIADHGFLVIQRPVTPVFDNLRASPSPE